jgi:aminoglycoside phosphotransferase (APT) family kinase protein
VGSLGAVVGRGRTATVYAWDEGQVVKLFHPDARPGQAELESGIAEAITAAGLPAPRYLGRVDVDGRPGLVFERVQGPSLFALMGRQPWRMLALAAAFARVHAAVHARSADLPGQRDYLRRQIGLIEELPERVRAGALEILDGLPDGDRACHGDFHPDNVLLTRSGPVVLDWITARKGVPATDVARTLPVLRDAVLPDDVPPTKALAFNALRRLFAWGYLRRYQALTGFDASQMAAWRVPLIVARLRENVPAREKAKLLAEAEAALL